MNILEKITKRKKSEIYNLKNMNSYSLLEKSNYFDMPTKNLAKRILEKKISIIAEHKRKSPSKSEINFLTKTEDIVSGYEKNGATGISVLTDEYFFGGSNNDLKIVKETCNIPILRKDFIVDEYQIIESKSIGADAILLIASILTKKEISKYSRLAKELDLNVLTEIHSLDELYKCDLTNIDIIGVNNRNLKTFEVNLKYSIEICSKIPSEIVKISESGIESSNDIKLLSEKGFDGFLIGERFMKSKDPGLSLKKFMEEL
jgi:indole-3-glycerol phosphate synthase